MKDCKLAATPLNQNEKFCKKDGAEKVDDVFDFNQAKHYACSKFVVKVHALC